MSDAEFVKKCTSGDRGAWNQFIDKYSRLIYNYIFEVLNKKGFGSDQHLPHEVYQELFYNLIKNKYAKLKSFKGKNNCSLASWLRQVAINFTIDYLRRLKPEICFEKAEEPIINLKDTTKYLPEPIYSLLDSKEKLDVLKECIEILETDDKYFLELFIYRQLNLEKLRRRFKISRGAVDMRKYRIIDRLKECFKSKFSELDF